MPDDTGTPGGETPPASPPPATPPAAAMATARAVAPPLTGDAPDDAPNAERRTPSADEEEPFDRERAMKTIRTLREEAKRATSAIKELDQLRKERQEAEDARLSEIDRAKMRAAQLEAQLEAERTERTARTNRYEVQLHAARLGIVDPEAAVRLMDWSTLEYADDGQPKDVEGALKRLLKERPYLAGQAPAAAAPPTSPTNGATRTGGPGQRMYNRNDLGDRDFYTAHRDDIIAAYKEGRILAE